MMALALGSSGAFGVPFLVAAGITYEIIAKDCSSPQTVEINASVRAATLMKWVHIGQVESIIFLSIAAYCDKKHRQPILLGGILAMIITEFEYIHAKTYGLAGGGAGTEKVGGYG